MATSSVAPRLLLVEDDPDLKQSLAAFLTEEGYGVVCASSLPQALALTQEQVFNGIFTTLFPRSEQDPLQSIEPLRVQTLPTPVAVLSGSFLTAVEAEQRGYAAVLELPFRMEDVLQALARRITPPFSPARAHQAHLIQEYLAALSQEEWERVRQVCLPTVQYLHLTPGWLSPATPLEGIGRLLAYAQVARHLLPGYRLEHSVVFEQRGELVTRYGCSWQGRDGERLSMVGSVVFRLVGERIAQIGVTLNRHRLRTLLAKTAAG